MFVLRNNNMKYPDVEAIKKMFTWSLGYSNGTDYFTIRTGRTRYRYEYSCLRFLLRHRYQYQGTYHSTDAVRHQIQYSTVPEYSSDTSRAHRCKKYRNISCIKNHPNIRTNSLEKINELSSFLKRYIFSFQ